MAPSSSDTRELVAIQRLIHNGLFVEIGDKFTTTIEHAEKCIADGVADVEGKAKRRIKRGEADPPDGAGGVAEPVEPGKPPESTPSE